MSQPNKIQPLSKGFFPFFLCCKSCLCFLRQFFSFQFIPTGEPLPNSFPTPPPPTHPHNLGPQIKSDPPSEVPLAPVLPAFYYLSFLLGGFLDSSIPSLNLSRFPLSRLGLIFLLIFFPPFFFRRCCYVFSCAFLQSGTSTLKGRDVPRT